MNASQDVIALLNSFFMQDSKTSTVVQSCIEHTKDGIDALHRLRRECDTTDHVDRGSAAMLLHMHKMESLVSYPEQLSVLVSVVAAWQQQQVTGLLSDEKSFCEKLVTSMLKETGVNVRTYVVFADRFGICDVGPDWFVTVPYALARRYNRWAGIAHEVGHAFQKSRPNVDVKSLPDILFDQLKGVEIDGQSQGVEALIINWWWNWLPELLADFVAFSLFGPFYAMEIYHLAGGLDFGSVSVTHPPMSVRLSCFRAALARAGIQIDKGNWTFESPPPVPESLDPALHALVKNTIAPLFIDWVTKQPGYAELKMNWNDIINPLGKFKPSFHLRLCVHSFIR